MKRMQSSLDNQNSDEMGGKDQLVNLGMNQGSPRNAVASDFPDGKTSASVGTGQGSNSDYEGLVPQNKNQEGPQHTEDGTSSTNDSMDEKASAVGANFKVSTNSGESSNKAVTPSIPESVDLLSGDITSSGYSQTRVKEVPDKLAHIG